MLATPTELADWIDKEHDAYKEFATKKAPHGNEPFASLSKAFRTLDAARSQAQKLRTLEADDTAADFVATLTAVTQNLNVTYLSKGLPPSNSYQVEALQPILNEEPHVALAALSALSSPQDPINFQHWDLTAALGTGLAAAIRFRIGTDGASSAFSEAARSAISSMNLRADETHARLTEQLRLSDESVQRVDKAWNTHNEDYAKLAASLTQKVEEEIDDAKKEITAFKNAHQAEIALKEPVQFWTDKGKSHLLRSRAYGIAGLTAAVGYVVAALLLLPKWLGPTTQVSASLASKDATPGLVVAAQVAAPIAGVSTPSYYGIALAIVLTTLSLWLLRILVRGYFSQTHLATDAEERVAMVKTYLALMESGKAPGDTLAPVMVALFRPASDGLVKDDSMPVGVAEFLTKPRN